MMDVVWQLVGVALIIFSANWLTDGAASIARRFGISDLVVGLTVVAFGTSTQELSISIVSALQGNAPMAIGNVVGSNIFNIYLVLGATATIRPLPFGGITHFDLIVMMLASLALWLFCWKFGKRTISRSEGAVLVAIYIPYIIYQVATV